MADRPLETTAAGKTTAADLLRRVGCGLAMGVCDAVPGVSGGTMALILGIYDRLIGSIAALLGVLRAPADGAAWRAAGGGLAFLLPLGIGIVAALVTALKLLVGHKPALDHLSDEQLPAALAEVDGLLLNPASAPIVFGFFFGLVVASIPEPWLARVQRRGRHWLLAMVGAICSGGLALAPAFAGSTAAPALLVAGMIAISVMLLPGISGSLALLILGMYQPISQAVTDRDLGILVWVGIGVVLGTVTFIPVLRLLLRRHHDDVMASLAGLMAGSLVALWPWKAHYLPELIARIGPMYPQAPAGAWWWVLISAAAGAGIIVLARRLGQARARAQAAAQGVAR